jgi:hypothetical protein
VDKKIFILVEGVADLVFLRDFIGFHFNYENNDKIKDSTIEISLKLNNNEIVIRQNKGKYFDPNKITDLKQDINKFNPSKVLAIFDADDDFQSSKQNLENVFEEIKKNMDSFLFPNNKNTGELETLLENIATKTDILDCWQSFEDCVKKKNATYTIPAKKSKIYTYLSISSPDKDKENCKERNRNYKDDKWDLNHNDIQPLKTFLDRYLI